MTSCFLQLESTIRSYVQLGTRNFGHHLAVTLKNCDVNHSLLST
jgi:hypothetical protein